LTRARKSFTKIKRYCNQGWNSELSLIVKPNRDAW